MLSCWYNYMLCVSSLVCCNNLFIYFVFFRIWIGLELVLWNDQYVVWCYFYVGGNIIMFDQIFEVY